MPQFGLVGGGHDDEIRQADKIGHIEGAGMRRPVGADKAGPVDGKAHGQVLDRDIMHDLIVGALQEGRIDRANGL